MCTSKAEGGKRCYSHLSKAVDKARAAMPSGLAFNSEDLPALVEAVVAYEQAVADLAANPTGQVALRKRAAAIEAGDTSGGYDDLTILRRYAPVPQPSETTRSLAEALATGRPTDVDTKRTVRPPVEQPPQTDGVFASSLAEALAYGKPVAPEARATVTRAPAEAWSETGLAALLRGHETGGDAGEVSPFGAGEVDEFPTEVAEDDLTPLTWD